MLEGAGKVFSAGVDVGEHMGDMLGPMLDAFTRAAMSVLDGDVPVLAVVQGAALGGACELIALCDLALVADDARIGVPEISLGVVPPVAAAVFPGLIGRLKACRDTLLPQLAALPGVSVAVPAGGMYAFFRIEGFDDSLALAKRLVAEAGLGLAPGAAFDEEGEGWLRWCFASRDPQRLALGVERLARFLRL